MNTTDPDKTLVDFIAADLKELAEGSAAVIDFSRSGQEGTFENPYFSKRRDQSLSRIHDVLRGRLMERLSVKPDVIQDRLSAWAKDARAESLAEYLTGIFPKLRKPDYEDLENEVVAAFKVFGSEGAPCFATWIVSKGEPSDPNTYVTAWMEARRGDALPPIPKGKIFRGGPPAWDPLPGHDMLHLSAVDGLLELFQCLRWEMLAGSLGNPEWLHLLADWWLSDKIEEEEKRLEQETGSMLLSAVRRITSEGSEIGMVAKPLAAFSWAFGGQGETVTIGEAFDIDVIVPRGASLLNCISGSRPFQALLPLSDDTPENQPEPEHLFALLASQHKEMMPIITGKLALIIMDACRRNTRGNGMIQTTLQEITRLINPDSERLRLSHYQTTLRALHSINGVRVVIPGEYVTYPVFDCPLPFREARPEEYDSPIFLGMARGFQSAIDRRKDGLFRGDFIFDMTKMMRLKKASQFRAGIAAYAEWNKIRANSGRKLPVIKTTLEDWGLRSNAFSTGALRAMAGDSKARKKKSEDMKEIESDLKELDGDKMLRIVVMHPKKGLELESMPYLEEAYWEKRTQNPRK